MAVGAFIGSVLGVFSVALYYYLLDWLTAPHLLYDGFFGISILFLAPQGAWLGATTGCAIAAARRGNTRTALVVSISGVLLFLITPIWFVIRDPLHFYPYEASARWSQFAYYFGGGLVWAGLLCAWAYLHWVRANAVPSMPD